jgi:hypothetical protein
MEDIQIETFYIAWIDETRQQTEHHILTLTTTSYLGGLRFSY